MDTLREAAKKSRIRTGNYALFQAKRCSLMNAAGVAAFSATRSKSAFIVESLNCYVIRDALLNDEADVGFFIA